MKSFFCKILMLPIVALLALSCESDKKENPVFDVLTINIGGDLVAQQPEASVGTSEYVFYVLPSATQDDLKTLAPVIAVTDGCTLEPASGTPQDFTNGPVTYTVTHNKTQQKKSFTLKCIRNKHKGAEITSISIEYDKITVAPQVPVDGTEISFTVSAQATQDELKSLAPVITVSSGATLSPVSGTPRDFTQGPVSYTVTAEDGTDAIYTVKCERLLHTSAQILTLTVADPDNILVAQPDFVVGAQEIKIYAKPEATPTQIAALVVNYTISDGASVAAETPASGSAPGFVDGTPVNYTVKAEGGEEATFTVTCIRNKYTEAKMLIFTFGWSSIIEADPTIPAPNGVSYFVIKPGTEESAIAALVPTITFSTGATMEVSAPNFELYKSIVYTITSESGTASTYTFMCRQEGSLVYDFEGDENWKIQGGLFPFQMHNVWDSPSGTVTTLHVMKKGVLPANGYPADRTTDAKSGAYAMALTTLTTKGGKVLGNIIPDVVPGSAFTGVFEVDFNDNLNSTKFGIAFDYMPNKVSFYYKYKKGSPFFHGKDAVADGVDGMSFAAVLYEIETAEECLNGHNLYTSEKIVAVAGPYTNTEDVSVYTRQEVSFVYKKPYDDTKKYKIAIVMASSKEGELFKGARGSELIVDDVELFYR